MADGQNIHNFIDALKKLNPERYGNREIFDNGNIGIRCSGKQGDCAVSGGGRRKRSSKKRKGSIKLLKKKRVKTNKKK